MYKNFPIFVQEIIVLLGNTHQLKSGKKNAKCSQTSPKEPFCALQRSRRKVKSYPSSFGQGPPIPHQAPQPQPRWLIPCLDVSGQHPCVEVALLGPDRTLRHCAVGAHPWHSAGEQPSRCQQVPARTPGHHLLSSGVARELEGCTPPGRQ